LIVITLGKRISGTVALTLLLITIIMAIGTSCLPNQWVFMTAIPVFDFATVTLTPAIFGFLMRRAPSARFAVCLGASSSVAGLLGPIGGGFLVEEAGFVALQWLNVALLVLTGLLLWASSAVATALRDDPPYAVGSSARHSPAATESR
jgi:MFS family permease